MAIEGKWVTTDGVQKIASSIGFPLPRPCVVLDGRHVIGNLDEKRANVARLALLFSIERSELSSELDVGKDWGMQMVSSVYTELGIKTIIEDDALMEELFGRYDFIMEYIQDIRQKINAKKKSKDMETMAFHMITIPEIQELT
jgi:hypothetical protein